MGCRKFLLYRFRRAQLQGREFGGNDRITLTASFVAEGDERIDAGRALRGDDAGKKRLTSKVPAVDRYTDAATGLTP